MELLDRSLEIEPQIVAWRRSIHENPELGFKETRTAKLVEDTLREMGVEVETGVGITGVVGRIGDGSKGPRIGIRADMDALPIQEAVDLPFASQTAGVMHACGHDAHTAMLLGVARLLTQMESLPNGEIRLLFQPSEEQWDAELKSGATRMIEDAALADLDAVIALHVSSELPDGDIQIGDGYMLAAVDTFKIVVKGEGCHGAHPDTGIDPIWIQAQLVNAIQAIRSRRTDPTSASVVTIGTVHGGSATNIIPHEVTLTGTIRTFSEDVRTKIHDELDKACQVTRAFGGDYTLHIEKGYPSLYNDPAVAQLMRDVATEFVGPEKTQVMKPQMGAEDFAYMTQQAPGAMLMLGTKYDDMHRPHHSPIFAISEKSLHVGTAVLAESALRLMNEHS